jgi:hypothetical protein
LVADRIVRNAMTPPTAHAIAHMYIDAGKPCVRVAGREVSIRARRGVPQPR